MQVYKITYKDGTYYIGKSHLPTLDNYNGSGAQCLPEYEILSKVTLQSGFETDVELLAAEIAEISVCIEDPKCRNLVVSIHGTDEYPNYSNIVTPEGKLSSVAAVKIPMLLSAGWSVQSRTYGYRWITNGTDNDLLSPGQSTPVGWRMGRSNVVGSCTATRWINDGTKQLRVSEEDLVTYLSIGYVLGQITTSLWHYRWNTSTGYFEYKRMHDAEDDWVCDYHFLPDRLDCENDELKRLRDTYPEAFENVETFTRPSTSFGRLPWNSVKSESNRQAWKYWYQIVTSELGNTALSTRLGISRYVIGTARKWLKLFLDGGYEYEYANLLETLVELDAVALVSVIDRHDVELDDAVKVYDAVVDPDNPYFQLASGIYSHNTVPAASELRRCYVPHYPDWIRTHDDYSGMELCVVAAIAGEQSMIAAFATGGDIHMNTAMGVFQLPKEEITPMMRRYAKICTFLLLYGGSVDALAAAIGGSLQRAQEIMEGFFRTYPALHKYIEDYRAHAQNHGWVPSIVGAPINLDIHSHQIGSTAINYPIQSSATMIGGVSLFRMWKAFKDNNIPWIPTSFTHDSIDADTHPMFYPIVQQVMLRISEEDTYDMFKCPARMDNEIGVNGYDISEVKIKSKLDSGLSKDDPIKLHLDGPAAAIEGALARFEKYFDVDVDIHKDEDKPERMTELWIAKRAFNTTFGQPRRFLDATLNMTYKQDHPLFEKVDEVLNRPYIQECKHKLENSFRIKLAEQVRAQQVA